MGLIATPRSLDPDGHETLPDGIRFTGPVWQGHPASAETARRGAPNFGEPQQHLFPGQQRVLQNILDALSGLPVRAIVTTGPAVPAQDLRVPENAELHSYLPHTDVLPTVSMVIGHGGHGTTMAALSYIVLPMARFTDQFKIGQALEKASAGQLLPKRSSPSRIRQAIEQVLGDERYRPAASRLGAEIRLQDGASVGSDAITEVLARSRQIDA